MEKLALIYDFDYTLSTEDSAFFSLLPSYNLLEDFYKKADAYREEKNMDMILTLLYVIWKKAKQAGRPLTKQILNDAGKNITFFNGVKTWFERINRFGLEHGFEVEHYIISSGILEIINGCSIAGNFKKIFASEYHYDEKGFADWPLASVNYTNKTQYIFRINKGILNNVDDFLLNGYMDHEKRAVQYKNMIYIGDGLTDVPCMKTMRSKKGYAIAVYSNEPKNAKELLKHKRCDKVCLADYSENSELDKAIKARILALENKN